MPYFVLAALLVALDQLVKYLVLTYIPLGGHVPFLPYVVELTYVKNTGAAFSLFAEHTWSCRRCWPWPCGRISSATLWAR